METQVIAEYRRSRLNKYLEGFGSDAEAAASLGIKPGHLSQLKMGKKPGKKTGRNIGEKLARSMESSADLVNGWFDGIESESVNLTADEAELIRLLRTRPHSSLAKISGWLSVEESTQKQDNEHKEHPKTAQNFTLKVAETKGTYKNPPNK